MSPALKSWLPVILWMVVIFCMSTDLGSSQHTSRIIQPLLRWLVPGISDATSERVHTLVRKGGHLTEYAILAGLTLRALRTSLRVAPAAWSWRAAGFTVLIAALYASSDEYHQSFVPSRGSSVVDVMIDTCGAIAGLAVIFLVWRTRRPARA